MGKHVRARASIVLAAVTLLALVAPPTTTARQPSQQNGARNYAGPTCPGDDWNCTKRTAGVVQTGDQNVFECTTGNCSVVQRTEGGSNQASCRQATSSSGAQGCAIDQTSTSGTNAITIDQAAALRSTARRAVQRSEQTSEIAQHSTDGANSLAITQHIDHDAVSLQGKKRKRQVQEATQRTQIVQQSTSGDQDIDIAQDQDLTQDAASTKLVTQNQNISDDGPDIAVDVDQITSSGDNTFDVDQDLTLTQSADAPSSEQLQGSDSGGAEVGSTDKSPEPWGIESDAEAGGTSAAVINQTKTWTQNSTSPIDQRSQRQIDRLRVASLGLSPDSTTVTQDADLVADPGAQQRCLQEVDTHAEVTGHATSTCTVDDRDGAPTTSTRTSNDPNLQYQNSVDSEDEHGSLSGVVGDATDGSVVAGASVEIVELSRSTLTQPDGGYAFGDVPAGTYTVRASAPGFQDAERDADIVANETTRLDFNLSPVLASGELRIVLSWGATPTDLDAHLWLPASKPYHLYFSRQGNLAACPHAALDIDTTSGFGPETITIAATVDGTYRYAVHQFSTDAPIYESDAVVQVFDESGLVSTLEVPEAGSPTNRWWKVLEITVTGGQATVSAVDVLADSSPQPYADTAAGCSA